MKLISNLFYNESYGESGLGDLYLPDQVSEKTPLALAIHGGRIESYYYNRRNDGHCIWIKDSDPHKLHPDIEKRIEQFISTLSLI